jgi:hypothetical protein
MCHRFATARLPWTKDGHWLPYVAYDDDKRISKQDYSDHCKWPGDICERSWISIGFISTWCAFLPCTRVHINSDAAGDSRHLLWLDLTLMIMCNPVQGCRLLLLQVVSGFANCGECGMQLCQWVAYVRFTKGVDLRSEPEEPQSARS